METSCIAKNVIFVWVLAIIALSPLACVKAGCTKEQTRALLEIKNATNASYLAGWDGRDCCEVFGIICDGITTGPVRSIYLEDNFYLGENYYASSRSTWYPNVTLFTLFDELEELTLNGMQIGGRLEGSIPFQMGDLSQLRSLNLSNNFLTGHIPNSFQNLKDVESLDLSHNKLSGGIPFEFVEMTSLSVFSVAYNNLSGRVPFERQFSTFETQCYDGNPDLCGNPLKRNCSTANQLEPGHEDEKEETRIIDSPLFFYAFVAVSYAFGFWVFFGILIINKNWRHIYFRAVDRIIESCFEMLYR